VSVDNGDNGDRRLASDRRASAERRIADRRAQLRRWLRPGIGIKRWLLVVFAGELLLALAGALVLRSLFRDAPGDQPGLVELLTLQFLPVDLRPVVLFAAGLVLFGFGWWRLLRVLIEPYQLREEPLVEMLYQRRLRARGPSVVAIGGGTGLSVLLRGLKEMTSNITAVVTVADDGGSSGKLRTEFGLPPMGDIRNCIAALADAEPAMTRLLQYRFPESDTAAEVHGDGGNGATAPGFAGHALGNLLIAALTDITGDFEEAVRQSNRVLAVRGNVVPVAGQPITLHAELADGSTVEGETRIAASHGIRRVWISPIDIKPATDAINAIRNADLIVIGPGSLYTSLLPALLVPGIREALAGTGAPRLLVCNVATQVAETEGYTLSMHLGAFSSHGLDGLIDAVLANSNFQARQPANYPAAPVNIDLSLAEAAGPQIIARDVVADNNAHHHDSQKLAATIFELYDERAIRRRLALAAS
jgi:uncharacterized cofD-like protein